ncbi:MAG: RagB/SusD family nutrient uptake outer membrane protein [Dysgonamonadaceae bacterium]|nr:RagB/SusD family nutrient uptake outer membrane protein [Dysgonamonadaceae bacterium]
MKNSVRTFKQYICIFIAFTILTVSCADYLDVVPDNITTVDHAFKSRYQAEGFLYGLFSFLPEFANPGSNPALMGGDEIWFSIDGDGLSRTLWNIPQGGQGTNAPLANYWTAREGENGGKPLFTALRDCNIFLENIHLPFDLTEDERIRWTGEALFLKAYYHFWLFRMYGPIPLMKENVEIGAVQNEVRPYREPVDEVVDYIASLIDSAVIRLPLSIEDVVNDMGRPTKAIALAVKAQALILAASPLFNGTEENGIDSDYLNVTDRRGIPLFPQSYSAERWQKATQALKEAIDMADAARHRLYDFRVTNSTLASSLNEKTILAMQVRGAATERWNDEIIWGDSRSNTDALQRGCQPKFDVLQGGGGINSNYAPTQRMVEQFYTNNGVPVDEDKEWVNIDPLEITAATEEDKFYIQPGYRTFRLYFNREARFYGSIIFKGGTLFGNGRTADNNLWVTADYFTIPGSHQGNFQRESITGYTCKKLLNFRSSATPNSTTFTQERYAFPIIRLADLYLMYAEALNEVNGPNAEVYMYIDMVRQRTGLRGVVESWRDHALDPDKPLTKAGMREIIRRERLNELAFEGSRFWDLKRWKLAEAYFNGKPIRGVVADEDGNISISEIFRLEYSAKDYLWPIKVSNLANNPNLVQNPGW